MNEEERTHELLHGYAELLRRSGHTPRRAPRAVQLACRHSEECRDCAANGYVRSMCGVVCAYRVGEREFIRPGGYFRRYYALEDLHDLVASAGVQLAVEELRYLCVRVANARRGLSMDRVFCHGVLRREEDR